MSVLAIGTLFHAAHSAAAGTSGRIGYCGAWTTEPDSHGADRRGHSPESAQALGGLLYNPTQGPAQEFTLSNANADSTGLDLVFTDVGARLKQGTVHVVHGEKQSLVPVWGDVAENEAVYPLSLAFQNEYLGDYLNKVRWTPETSEDGRSLSFQVQLPEPYSRHGQEDLCPLRRTPQRA